MKKSVLAFAALSLVSGIAAAQSSVTVFGIVDVAVRNLKGGGSLTQLINEGRSASRLGFRGTEALGGGLKAGFHIEHGFNPDTGGADSVFWQRRATVSLMGDFGEVRLGRNKWADRTIQDDFDPFGTSGIAAVTRVFSSLGMSVPNRANNYVGYYLPSAGGFYGNFDVAAGEATDNDKGYAARLGYKNKQLNVSAAYGQHGAGNKFKSASLAGSYAMGDFTLLGLYTKNERGADDQSILNLGLLVKMGSGKVTVSVADAEGSGTNKDAKLMALGYDYSLSKRTTMYTTVARVSNDGNATFSLNGTTGAAAVTAGGNSTGYEVGIRHTF